MATQQKKKKSGAPAPHVHTKHLRYSWNAGLILLAVLIIFLGFNIYLHMQYANRTVTIPSGALEPTNK